MWGIDRLSILAFALTKSGPIVVRSSTNVHKRCFTSSSSALSAMQYLLRYSYVPDVLEKRGPFREAHLGLAKQLVEEGTCLSGGPTSEPGASVPKGALFIFSTEAAAHQFLAEDPYVSNGIVTEHSIEEWNVVVQKE
ncbi:hypothetical protein MPSEU_000222500 [Mayamaea pseudoterrestris]|nr:hypothetical protein MPSEU_000222500 [Mayamaea pseudoterrestris]